MLQNWTLFNESKQEDEINLKIEEVILFFIDSTHNVNPKLHEEAEDFLEKYGGYTEILSVITEEEKEQKMAFLNRILTGILNNEKDLKILNKIYDGVRKTMNGFPKFTQLEEIFLEYQEQDFEINMTFTKPFKSDSEYFTIEVSKFDSVNFDLYRNFISKTDNLIKRIKIYCPTMNVNILQSEYSLNDSTKNYELSITISISKK
jgi:hypothetical protein